MAKQIDESVNAEDTDSERSIVIKVDKDGGYNVTMEGEFMIMELYNIVDSFSDKVKYDYTRFVETSIIQLLDKEA